MDWLNAKKRCREFIGKNRYILLVVVIGLAMMLLPQKKTQKDAPAETTVQETAPDPARELENLLAGISGAGRVQVMLTVEKGAETLYQENVDTDAADQSNSSRHDTVLVTGTDRSQQGLIRQENAPVYRGAVVLCQGADKAAVKLAIVEAVSCATGLGSDRISVLKMK